MNELDGGPMSALGQKQTYAAQNDMSALPPKATAKAGIESFQNEIICRLATKINSIFSASDRCGRQRIAENQRFLDETNYSVRKNSKAGADSGTCAVYGKERISTQTVFHVLEVPHRSRARMPPPLEQELVMLQ